jgi:sulfur-oxidizing protein SoxA
MKGVAARYPEYDEKLKKLMNVEERINNCRVTNMKAKTWKYDSNDMLGMAIFVNNQSRGMPRSVKIDGPAASYFEKGKEFYYQRRGQLDMSCAHCHEKYFGERIRMNTLTQGQSNGFPTYRLKWQKPGSLHRRFSGCNKQVRAKAFKRGSPEYMALELYLAWRGQGLPIETPAVRN